MTGDTNQGAGTSTGRERFSSGPGFILAAAGSAVGLGNMWRFSYMTAEGGGAAFVLLYVMMTVLIGIPVMSAESPAVLVPVTMPARNSARSSV